MINLPISASTPLNVIFLYLLIDDCIIKLRQFKYNETLFN
jgi:hypothetical protein